MAKDIFISYSRKDSEAAETIVRYLLQSGLTCYVDAKNIPGSAEWMAEIVEAIEDCHSVVALVSKQSVTSAHVRQEIAVAVEGNRPLVPVFLSDDIKVPQALRYPLAGYQRIMAIPSLEAALPSVEAGAWTAVDRSRNKGAFEDWAKLCDSDRLTYDREVNFASERCGLPVGRFDHGLISIEGGVYVMAAAPRDYLGCEMAALPGTTDFVLEGTITKMGGPDDSWYGFEFGERWPGGYYQFVLNGQGCLRIAKHWQEAWIDLGSHTDVRHLRRGNSENSLRVVRMGRLIHVFVNGRHGLSVEDGDIRTGRLGIVVGWGIRAGFTDIRIKGIDLESLFNRAMVHWNKLEVPEAKALLTYIQQHEPSYKHPSFPVDAAHLLLEIRPDRRKSVLIVVGWQVLPQLHDGIVAARLRDEINRRGRQENLETAFMVTDTGLLQDQTFMQCSLICIGGSVSNQLTATIADQLEADPVGAEWVKIQHAMSKGDKRVALWGGGAAETARAVDLFITSGLLDRFLGMLWEREIDR